LEGYRLLSRIGAFANFWTICRLMQLICITCARPRLPHPTSQASRLPSQQRAFTTVQCCNDNMLSPLSRFQADASSHANLALPVLLFLACLVVNISTPARSSLLTNSLAWLAVCASRSSKANARSLLNTTPARKTAWVAGSLFALAQLCDKAVDGRAIWWAKVI
jgi:hypothetical protein